MNLQPLHDPDVGQMRIAGLMSGSGSNLVKILEKEQLMKKTVGVSDFTVAVIFSDNKKSNAEKIGKEFDVPVVVNDIRDFYKARGQKTKRDMGIRAEYDAETVKLLEPYGVMVAAYAGYMSLATPVLFNTYLGVNVHPANLRIVNGFGERVFTGDNAVYDAIIAGQKEIRSTTHIVEEQADQGKILMVSAPVKVELPENFDYTDKELTQRVADNHQDQLKEKGDWVIFPQTLEYIATGRFAFDDKRNLYFNEQCMPAGIRLENNEGI